MTATVVDGAATNVDTSDTVTAVPSGTGTAHSWTLFNIHVYSSSFKNFFNLSRYTLIYTISQYVLYLTNTITGTGMNFLNYHGIDALNSGSCTATSVVDHTFVDISTVITIPWVSLRTRITEERSRSISTSNPRIHRTRSMVFGAFVHVFDTSWVSTLGLPTLKEYKILIAYQKWWNHDRWN